MKLTKWLLVALSTACFSANAADMFFVIGQVGTRWPGQQGRGALQAEVKVLSWNVGSKFTSVGNQICKKDCSDVDLVDGVVPAFANTWTALSKSQAHFVIYRKPDVALTLAGAESGAYWTDFENRKGVYQDALFEFRKAQKNSALSGSGGISRRYMIWVQNEADVRANVSTTDYQVKLIDLFDRFNKDLGTDDKAFDAMFIVSSGTVRVAKDGAASQNGGTTSSPDRLSAIVQAQDRAAAQGKIVMISRSMRRSVSDCTGSPGRPGCATDELLRYQSWLYESLGEEMALNAFTYHTKGIKPLLPDNCKQEPASCAGTVDVYRWMARGDVKSKPVYGTDPYEFDETAYYVDRMRFALFLDNAPGRIPLYRNAEAAGIGLSTEPGSAKAKVLGYCYATPNGNANAKLMGIVQDGMSGIARQSAGAVEAIVPSLEREKTLCYVN